MLKLNMTDEEILEVRNLIQEVETLIRHRKHINEKIKDLFDNSNIVQSTKKMKKIILNIIKIRSKSPGDFKEEEEITKIILSSLENLEN